MRRGLKTSPAKTDSTPKTHWWSKVRPEWLAAAFLLFVLGWVVTDGEWDMFSFRPANYEEFYDGQAISLLHGRIDVSLEAIRAERFERNGKYYGYFGPTPALPRMPLELLFPNMYGRWSRLSMLLGSVFGMAMLILLFRRIEQILGVGGRLWAFLRCVLLFAVFLGTTNLFISTVSRVYQEAIMWASALTLAHAVFLISYLREPSRKWLVLSCVSAFLAFNAKVSSGAGTLVALSIIDAALILPSPAFRNFWGAIKLPAGRQTIAILTVTLVLSAASWAGLNYSKYGIVFTSQPLHLTPHPDPVRIKRIHGDPFSLANVPLMLWVYLSPANIRFRPVFPWIYLLPADPKIADAFPSSHFDGIEPVASVTATMPILFVGAIAGMVLCFVQRKESTRLFRAALAGTLAGSFLILGWGYISYRFLHDALPWLALGTTIAVAHIPLLASKRLRIGLTALFVLGTVWSIWVNGAFAVMYKRWDTMPEPDRKRVAFFDLADDITKSGMRGAIGHLTHWRTYIPASDMSRGNVSAGNTVYTFRPDVSLIWYDGPPPGIAEYVVDFPEDGIYEISLLYASPDSRPLRLLVNDVQVLQGVCGAPTGGPYLQNERWCKVGAFHIPGGASRFTLLSDGKFPIARMIRIIKL